MVRTPSTTELPNTEPYTEPYTRESSRPRRPKNSYRAMYAPAMADRIISDIVQSTEYVAGRMTGLVCACVFLFQYQVSGGMEHSLRDIRPGNTSGIPFPPICLLISWMISVRKTLTGQAEKKRKKNSKISS